MTHSARIARAFALPLLLTILVTNTGRGQPQTALPHALSLPASQPVVQDPVRLLRSDGQGVRFVLEPAALDVRLSSGGASVVAAGCDRLARPAEPDLPSRIVLVGVPQEGNVRLSVSTSGTRTQAGVDVRPATGFGPAAPAASLAAADRWWPEAAAELLSIETMRGIRVARVKVNPAQYHAATRTLRLHDEVQVSLTFEQPARTVARQDPLDRALRTMLLNGADARQWSGSPPLADSINFFDRSPVWCKVTTETTGIYRLTPAELKTAGYKPDEVDPRTMKLYTIGSHAINGPYPDTMVELPVYVQDNGDGKFSSSDFLAFYAEAPSRRQPGDSAWRFNPFTPYSCYWLTWGGGSGRRMATVSAAGAVGPRATAPRRLRVEYDSLCPARSGLLWVWKRFFKQADIESGGGPLALNLPGRDTIYSLAGRLYGVSPSNALVYKPVVLALNGAELDTIRVGARASQPPATDFSFPSLPPGAAARGAVTDTLMVRLVTAQEEDIYVDYLEVRYAQQLKLGADIPYLEFAYDSAGTVEFSIDGAARDGLILDVTDPLAPRAVVDGQASGSKLNCRLGLSGTTRFAGALKARLRTAVKIESRTPGHLRTPAEQADFYIICPDEFEPVARAYARYRQDNVSRIPDVHVVKVALLSEIVDDYAFGMAEPGAIKRFLQAKRPAYVLLAGDGTYDYKNVLGQNSGPMLLAYETGYDMDPEVYGQTARALDAWYADIDGPGSSPDMILGRVTARSAAELRTFLDKVRRYEQQPLGYWAKRLVLLADDEYLGDPDKPDGIGFAHISGCEQIASIGHPLLDPVKVYLTEYQIGQRGSGSEAALRSELNRGALLWFFFGHGAGFQLNHEQTLHITSSVPNIHNGSRTPLAYFGSCGVGRFDDTKYSSIAEELVRRPDGCIASSGATKATSPGGNELLARTWITHLLSYPQDPVGLAFYAAWNTNTLYHLFGDPATVLRTPSRAPEPAITPDTFYPGRRTDVVGPEPLSQGSYEIAACEAQWYRSYESDVGATSYLLPGYTIHRGNGTFASDTVRTSFVVPTIPYPESTIVPNGTYVREPGTGRVSLLAWRGTEAYSSLRASIPLGAAAASEDQEPPEITLYADDTYLDPTDTTLVPKEFALNGVLSDPSGILLVPIPDLALSLAIGASTRPDLADYFSYDRNSTTTGRFSYPVELTAEEDSLTTIAVRASDNVADPGNPGANRATVSVSVRARIRDVLRLSDCLVYPNPAADRAAFTFNLTLPALVSVKIFTIAGRLVRRLEPQQRGFGFGQVEWDGLDKDGSPVSNGIYLYRIDARALDSGSNMQTTTASHRDKFLVHR